MRRSAVLGAGSALPKRRVTNEELAKQVDTSDEWIVERTGIRSRYVAGEGETTASLAADAARRALEHAGIDASEIDLIVLGTHGRGTLGHFLMGSVAERVVRLAGCPVLTVRQPERDFVHPDALARVEDTAVRA